MASKRAAYKLATYSTKDGPRAGIIVGEAVFDAAKVTGKAAYASVAGILADWKTAERALRQGRRRRRHAAREKPAARQDQTAGAGAASADHFLRRRQLRRPRRGDGAQAGHAGTGRSARARIKAVVLHQGRADHRRSGRHHQSLALRKGDGLGDRACRGDRPPGEGRAEGEGARLRRRLHRRKRPLGARPRPPARHRADFVVQDGLDQAQKLRRLLPDRAVDRAGKRHRRSAKTRLEALGQRRAQAEFQHRKNAVHTRRADRAASRST